jgi:hypothetical protein
MELSAEEREKIYAEEKARMEIRAELAAKKQKNKIVAAILALLLGMVGGECFYLRETKKGKYLASVFVIVIVLIYVSNLLVAAAYANGEGIIWPLIPIGLWMLWAPVRNVFRCGSFLLMSQEKFDEKYNSIK